MSEMDVSLIRRIPTETRTGWLVPLSGRSKALYVAVSGWTPSLSGPMLGRGAINFDRRRVDDACARLVNALVVVVAVPERECVSVSVQERRRRVQERRRDKGVAP